jgi:hypothetical protein
MDMSKPILSTEKALEKRVSDTLTRLGYLNWHNDPTTMPGIPDRYVRGGTFIEFKHEPTFEKAMRGFDRQRTFMNKLESGGDEAWACALIGNRLYFEPWRVWKKREAMPDRRTTPYLGYSPWSLVDPIGVDTATIKIARLLRST